MAVVSQERFHCMFINYVPTSGICYSDLMFLFLIELVIAFNC